MKRAPCRGLGPRGVTLIEILIVFALLGVLIGPLIHVYVITTRGMKSAEDELVAMQLCLHVVEGLQSVPFSTIPDAFPEAPVSSLPATLVSAIGWLDPQEFAVTVSIETRRVPIDGAAATALAPDATDPRRERLDQQSELRVVRVVCRRLFSGVPGSQQLMMSTLIGWQR